MSKLETNTIDTISGSTTLTLGGTNATTIAQDSSTTVTGFKSTGIDDNASANALTIDSSANLQFNSGFGSVSTAYGVRAWIRFDGTGTISIDASGGVSSIADVGTGSYTINLSPSMPDVNYSIAVNPANGLLSTGNQQFPVTVCDWVGSSSFTVNVRQCDNNDNTFVSADGDPISVIVSR